MPDNRERLLVFGRRSASPVMLVALLFSVLVHAAAGSLLLSDGRYARLRTPPLMVTLQRAPPPVTARTPLPTEYRRVKREKIGHPIPVSALRSAPGFIAATVERTDAAPAVMPAPETAPEPAIVADVRAAVDTIERTGTPEPPHFSVAYLRSPLPVYPAAARKLGLEGVVVLRVHVSAGGAAEHVAVARTSGVAVLDAAALRAVQGWTFVPARRGDTPIANRIDVPVRFQLEH